MNSFCPNVYKKTKIWTKPILMGLIFLRFFSQKPAKSILFFDISLVSDRKSLLFSFLEMLIVFHVRPMTVPSGILFFHGLQKSHRPPMPKFGLLGFESFVCI
jgi:hypothetical protein